MARIGVLYDKDIKERVFGVFATNDSIGSYVLTLTASPTTITQGQSTTITATLTNKGRAVQDKEVTFSVGGTTVGTGTTDTYGQATYTYQGTVAGTIQISASSNGVRSVVNIVVNKYISITAEFTGDSIELGYGSDNTVWITSNGVVEIDWGDGSTSNVNNPTTPITHNYSDGESRHTVVFAGCVTGIKDLFHNCRTLVNVTLHNSITVIGSDSFVNTALTSIIIPNSVTTLRTGACTANYQLASVTIPSSVTNFAGSRCFYYCPSLVDYQLYWTGNNMPTYNNKDMPNNTNTIFTIPDGQTANYVAKGYPSDKLVERS